MKALQTITGFAVCVTLMAIGAADVIRTLGRWAKAYSDKTSGDVVAK